MKISCLDVVINERLRKIDTDKVSQIAESIIISGLLQPIIIDSDNILLDGNHRLQACISLGYDEIECIIRSDIEEIQSELIEIDTNLCRNDLNPLEQAIHIQKRIQILDILGKRKQLGDNQHNRVSHHETPLKSAKDISREIGVSRGDYYRKLKMVDDLTPYSIERLMNSSFAKSTTSLVTLSREQSNIQNLVTDNLIKLYNGKSVQNPERLIRTEISVVKSGIKKDEIRRILNEYSTISLDDRCQLYNDDFNNVMNTIDNDSIDLIFTDPPYPKETIHLYEELSIFARDKLKNGCLCMAYCSVQILPYVMEFMSRHLTYYHTICISYKSGKKARFGNWFNEWKPIVMFYKGDKPLKHPQISDKITSPDVDEYDKTLHRWAQPLYEPLYYIGKLTSVNGLVCDPMMGTGTTGIADIQLGRKFIGIEINPETFGMADCRIKKIFNDLTRV